jgi:hypothetical protein
MRVRNWERWQHYRDRNPPWIKFHYEALSSRWWISLDGNHRALALTCLLIASRHGGHVPNDIDYVRQVGHIKSKSTFKPLLQCRFLIPESGSEVEKETETEAQNHASAPQASATSAGFNAFWSAYPKRVGKKEASRAWDRAKDRPPIADILAAILRAEQSKQWRDGFIPNPATWLNQGRWDDEVTPQPTDKTGRPHVSSMRCRVCREDADDLTQGMCGACYEADKRERGVG